MSLASYVPAVARQWVHQPRLAAITVLTLALGIGGATTMYAFLQAFGRFGLPTVPQAEEVGRLFTPPIRQTEGRGLTSLGDFRRWQQTAHSFEGLAAYASDSRLWRATDVRDEVDVTFVTPNYFALLRTPPVLGRFFNEQESRSSGSGVAVLGEKAWRERFQADPSVLGRTLELEGQVFTIIGVTAYRLGLVGSPAMVYLPFDPTSERASVMVIGRRRSTTTWDQVRAEMTAIGVSDPKAQLRVRVVPILEDAAFRARAGWMILVGPAVVVLLIGCGNVASLLLVRAVQREREVATRLALGASRRQLAAQFLVEGWILASVGGAFGALLSYFGLRGLRAFVPATIDIQLALDGRALLFAGLATLFTPLVFGAAPLLHSLRLDLSGALRAGLRRPLLGLRQYHMRDVFAILEVASAVALVTFAFEFLSLISAVREVDLSFDADGLVQAVIPAPQAVTQVGPVASAPEQPRQLRERIAAIPGVTRVTVGDEPFGETDVRLRLSATGPELAAHLASVDGSYFETLGLPLLRGRAISEGDAQRAAAVAVLSESLSARLWPHAQPLGQTLRVARGGTTEVVEIVGIARDAVRLGRVQSLEGSLHDLDGLRLVVYRPRPVAIAQPRSIIARVSGRPTSLYEPMRAAVQAVDPKLRLRRVVTLRSTLDLMGHEFAGGGVPLPVVLMLGFGSLALLLAVIGVFGVMRQLVDERQAELGLRLALGASPESLARSVIGDGLIRAGVGSSIGVFGVAAIAKLTFGGLLTLCAADPRYWTGIIAAVTLTSAAACYLPARRAARVDPMVTMRCE